METSNHNKILTCVALVGNPNAGKSTLFNALTGLNQKTGNFPGVTVDKKSGFFRIKNNSTIDSYRVIDLPGTYSLFPKSPDEKVACEVLLNENEIDYPDIIIAVADATNLKRSLLLTTQLIDLSIPVILALNMSDEANDKGILIDAELLQKELGIPVVFLNSRKEEGIDILKNKINEIKSIDVKTGNFNKENKRDFFNKFLNIDSFNKQLKKEEEQDTINRFKAIGKIIDQCVKYKDNFSVYRVTEKIDNYLTHPVFGFVTLLKSTVFTQKKGLKKLKKKYRLKMKSS